MSEMVIMPKADWQAALDATRAKTGKGELIKSGELAAEIEGITGGGGKPFDCRSVTFMHDGAELYVRSVGDGDTCADPVVRGLVEAPTKESTAQYTYPHNGWSLTDGGSASSSALANVTEDRTVYAAFSQATRYYTVNYYDGDTLLHSVQVAYGGTPPAYTPSKDGYDLSGWDPAISTIYSDTNYYAVWSEKTTFLGGTWEEIAAISEAGKASEYFSIGDTKTISASGVNLELIVIGFDHDDLADGSGKAGMTIVATSTFSNTMSVEDWSVLANNMRTTLKPKLPSDLQSVIKPVTKQCDVAGRNTTVTPTNITFDLFPLSFNECDIRKGAGMTSSSADWTKYFTPLGSPYKYFQDQYNATWGGPYSTFLAKNNGFWFRQWLRGSAMTPEGLYNAPSFVTTRPNFGVSIQRTQLKTVMLAFCI